LSKRIISSNVQLGESYKLAGGGNSNFQSGKDDIKDREFMNKLDLMHQEAQNQANAIIYKAKEQAALIIEQEKEHMRLKEEEAESQRMAAFDKTEKEGMQSGYDKGLKNAYEEVYSKVANLEAIASAAFKLKKEIILSAEQEILQLSIAVAERILKQQLEIKPQIITEIIKAAVLELKDKEEIKIIINPALKEQLYSFSEEMKTMIKGMKTVKIVEDKTIHPDSAIIESPESRIDARLEAQISEITREIMKTFSEEPDLKKFLKKDKK